MADAERLDAYAPSVLENRTVGAVALLAVCGGITMAVNLLVMDARAGHIGEISSNNANISAPPAGISAPPAGISAPPAVIAGPSENNATPRVAVLGTVITAPGITAASAVVAEPTAVTSVLSTSGDD